MLHKTCVTPPDLLLPQFFLNLVNAQLTLVTTS